MSKVLKDLYYSEDHEWVKVDGDVAQIGITDHAQEAMGDFVYVDAGIQGANISKGDSVAVLESVKAASDVYSPVSGTVAEVNSGLADAPENLNSDPYGSFIFTVKLSNPGELDALMSADAYEEFCKGE